ncbi:MAG: hypothetical protein JSR50_12405, partial [Proteobacteria bacterium]|nr:hypothetical protein [Pseudomonadota bacterium]
MRFCFFGKNELVESGPWAGFEIVSRYTRAQAIEDGALVDVTEQAKRCGFVVPVAMTAALFGDCQSWAEDAVWRLLHFACETIRASSPAKDTDRLSLRLTPFVGTPKTAIAHMGPGDAGEPVVTLMYPDEE